MLAKKKWRIAFYGGSFDPVHNGHLRMASVAVEALQLDQLLFVPARQNPHKAWAPLASDEDRLEMLLRCTRQHPRFGVWTGELQREGNSYTIDSVEHIERTYPNSHILWLIGSDQLEGLRRWHDIAHLVNRVTFVLVQRPGFPFRWPGIAGLRMYRIENPLDDHSSSKLRELAAAGIDLTPHVPPEVARFIRNNHLYLPDIER